MKTKVLSIVIAVLISGFTAYGQDHSSHKGHDYSTKTATSIEKSSTVAKLHSITVQGSCGMCKSRIETAAKSVDGVLSASWNSSTKVLEVELVPGADIHKVHMAIAKAGHDTDMHKADNKAYNALPGCCQYR